MEKTDNIILHRRFLIFYRKNTLALFFSFALSFMLASAMLVLIHTNHRTENIEYQSMFSPSDCFIEDLSWKQAEMLKNNENRIVKIVAMNSNAPVSPCGRCREMIRMVNEDNMETEVMVDNDTVVKLRDLLPYAWNLDTF